MNHYISLTSIKTEGNILKYDFISSLNVFKKRSFFIEYREPIQHSLDSINAIPFAAIMAPISWAAGANLSIPALDADYVQSLEDSSHFWRKCFGNTWSFQGRLMTNSVRESSFAPTKTGMLFSGGLDSLTSYIRHRNEKPELFTVIGADFPYSHGSFTNMCKAKLFDRLARQEGISLNYIYTDIGEVLDFKKLKAYAPNWYGAVLHGLMLTSLVAPLTHHYLKTLLVASCSHKPDTDYPCGGEPEVIRSLRWANTRVLDDLHELNRSQKIGTYLKNEADFHSYLRVCWSQFKELNCSKCEKCLRTICEILLNNMDPNRLNFKVTEQTLPALKKRISGHYNLFFRGNEMVLNFWRSIQESINPDKVQDLYGSKEFFTWLATFDGLKRKNGKLLQSLLNFIFGIRDELSHVKHGFFQKVRLGDFF